MIRFVEKTRYCDFRYPVDFWTMAGWIFWTMAGWRFSHRSKCLVSEAVCLKLSYGDCLRLQFFCNFWGGHSTGLTLFQIRGLCADSTADISLNTTSSLRPQSPFLQFTICREKTLPPHSKFNFQFFVYTQTQIQFSDSSHYMHKFFSPTTGRKPNDRAFFSSTAHEHHFRATKKGRVSSRCVVIFGKTMEKSAVHHLVRDDDHRESSLGYLLTAIQGGISSDP